MSPSGPENPASQEHAVTAALPAGEMELSGQAKHTSFPFVALYVPVAHSAHVPWSNQKPALQVHDNDDPLPAGESEFPAHCWHVLSPVAANVVEYLPDPQLSHVDSAVAPTLAENLPTPQSLQTEDPPAAVYLPASHCVHVPPSGPENPTLQPHDVTVALPAAELELDGHEEHVASSEAPTPSEYLPASQLLHASDPATTLKVPAAHSVHVSPLGPEYPALQMHAVRALLPAGALECVGQSKHVESSVAPKVAEYLPDPQLSHIDSAVAPTISENLPAPQLLHAAAPVTALYLPDSHCVHVSPSGPVKPTLQAHDVNNVLPASETEFDGHGKHTESDVAPTLDEYVPAAQLLHASDPIAFSALYLPASHWIHVLPSGPENPALQEHAVTAALPAGEMELTGQAEHVESSVAASATE